MDDLKQNHLGNKAGYHSWDCDLPSEVCVSVCVCVCVWVRVLGGQTHLLGKGIFLLLPALAYFVHAVPDLTFSDLISGCSHSSTCQNTSASWGMGESPAW